LEKKKRGRRKSVRHKEKGSVPSSLVDAEPARKEKVVGEKVHKKRCGAATEGGKVHEKGNAYLWDVLKREKKGGGENLPCTKGRKRRCPSVRKW